jgi:hypothetical protein
MKVTVYKMRFYDVQSDTFVVSRRMATEEGARFFGRKDYPKQRRGDRRLEIRTTGTMDVAEFQSKQASGWHSETSLLSQSFCSDGQVAPDGKISVKIPCGIQSAIASLRNPTCDKSPWSSLSRPLCRDI